MLSEPLRRLGPRAVRSAWPRRKPSERLLRLASRPRNRRRSTQCSGRRRPAAGHLHVPVRSFATSRRFCRMPYDCLVANVDGKATAITVAHPGEAARARSCCRLVFWAGRQHQGDAEEARDALVHPLRPVGGDRALPATRAAASGCTTPTCCSRATSTGPGTSTSTPSRRSLPFRMKAIWGTSFGFPGPLPVEPFKAVHPPQRVRRQPLLVGLPRRRPRPRSSAAAHVEAALRRVPRARGRARGHPAAFKVGVRGVADEDPARPVSDAPQHQCGQAYSLTVLTPILDGPRERSWRATWTGCGSG